LSSREDILPMGISVFQSLIGCVSISIVGVLGEGGLNKDIKRINPFLFFGNAISPL